MNYYRKKFYNKDTKEFKENAPKHILMLDFSGQELEKLCKGDKMMEKFKENVNALNDNSTVINFLTKEEEERIQKEAYMREGYENGIEAGEKNGIKIGKEYNVPINVDTIRRRYPIKWTYQEGIKSLIVDTKIWVF